MPWSIRIAMAFAIGPNVVSACATNAPPADGAGQVRATE